MLYGQLHTHTRTHSSHGPLLHPLLLVFFLLNFEMKSHFSCIEHMISQSWGQRLADCTPSQTVKNTITGQTNKPPDLVLVSRVRCHRVITTSRVQETKVEQLRINSAFVQKLRFFPNTSGASRSLFLCDVPYVLTDFILSQFWESWLWQQRVCSDLSCVFLCVQAVMNGSVLIVFSQQGQTEPRPALQHKHCIPASPLLTHQPETRTRTEVWAGFRPGGQRWCVCVAGFPVGRAPGQLDITLTGGQNTNHSRNSLQRLQSEQEPGLNVSRDSPPNCSATKTEWLTSSGDQVPCQ